MTSKAMFWCVATSPVLIIGFVAGFLYAVLCAGFIAGETIMESYGDAVADAKREKGKK